MKHILILAEQFLALTKLADLKANMAKRIMFSLLSHLVPQGQEAQIHATKGMVDYKALKQMIPGAKELIEYGTAACIDEAENTPDDEALEQILTLHSEDPRASLPILISLFNDPELWPEMYGGKPWAKICETILNIQTHLDKAEYAKSNRDYDQEIQELMTMTSYVNVLDGLAHNTGSIMDKMLRHEEDRRYPDDHKTDKAGRRRKTIDEVNKLMDIKELQDPDDVLAELYPYLEKSDAALTLKDWMSKARQRRHEFNNRKDIREKELNKIRNKKEIIQSFHNNQISQTKDFLIQMAQWPDSKIMSNLLTEHSTKLKFHRLTWAAENVLKFPIIPEQNKHEIADLIPSAFLFAGPVNGSAFPNLPAWKEYIASLGFYQIRQHLDKAYDLIQILESTVNAL